MKKLSTVVLFALIFASCLSAQDSADPTLEEIRAARKTMDAIELYLVRSSEDKHAAALILEDKQADENVNLYLIEVPGYQESVTGNTLLDFKKNVKSDDKIYKKLTKAASKTQTEKEEYIASINPNYQEALQLYNEATN